MSTSERTPLLSGTINGPTGRQVQNALPSKGQRIKVAEAVGAFQAGKLPSQQQISQIIQTILDSDTIKSGGGTNSRTARLGREGQQVLQNFRRVLSATKAWGEDKNDNDLLQNFFYNATTADIDIDINTPNAPSKQEMSKDSKRAIESARSIASLIVTNPAFRQLGSDAILITRDLFADAASAAADQAGKAAEQARPSEAERKDGVDFENLSKKGKKTAKGLASGRIQGEVKESIWDELENGKHWVDENIPAADEAKDKVISRVQQVITAAQKDPEYRRSVTAIVNIFKKYANKAQEALDETKEKSAISDEDEKVQQAGRDLRTFVERITNKSLDDVVSAAQKAGEDIKNDEKLGKYFKELENYLDRLLYQPGYVASNAAYKKASSLYDDAQSLLAENEQWKKDAGELQKQLEEVVEGVKNDKPTLELVDALEDLANSLATAGQIGLGSLKVDGQGLYRDFVDVIVPRLIALVKEIPVPRVEFKSEDVDLVIDDIKLESASFIPDSVRFVQHNDLQFTQGYATYASEYDATLRLRVEGLHFSASNIAFWISKKTGFMPFQDSGILDIEFGPKGINFDVTLENADEDDRESFFTVKKVDVAIEGFDYHLRDHEKWFATWFAKPILRAFIKRNLTHALEVQISENLRTADLKMFAVQQRAIAATNARPSAANFVNAVFRDSIFPQSSTTGPVEVKSTGVVKYGRHGEYVLHVGVDEELFPDQPPARVSNKQREKAKAAVKNTTRQAKGSAEQFKKEAQNAADKGKKEVNELDARKKEQQRRENKTEGWRSECFSV